MKGIPTKDWVEISMGSRRIARSMNPNQEIRSMKENQTGANTR